MSKTVNGVLGPIREDRLGAISIHEHLYVKPNELPLSFPYTLDRASSSLEEVCRFKRAGGSTIVEMTPINFGRNTEALRKIAQCSGVNIVCVTGFHKEQHIPRWFDEMTDGELASVIIDEIVDGIGSSHVLPGAIKVGTSCGVITGRERRAIEICGSVARDFDLPMITHCDRGTMALDQIDLLERQGVSPQRICLSHVDLSLDAAYVARICATGAYVSFDHVGRELNDHDARRIALLSELVRAGYANKICLAGDMGKKTYLRSYGGTPGLDYILTEFKRAAVPTIGEEAFAMMTDENPCQFLVR